MHSRQKPRPRLTTIVRVGVVMVGAAAAVMAMAGAASAWTQVGIEHIASLSQGQGLATVHHADGSSSLYYDGTTSVPADKSAAGWNHVGDPDSSQGYIFEPFQAADASTNQKLFHVITPDGTGYDYVHHDFAGEQINNSFVAVSPDSQWMVAGEWDSMTRLLVFPTPVLNSSTSPTGGTLTAAPVITLDKTVVDIQGCAFTKATQLMCSSDDPVAENGFPRKALLQVDLPHALDGTAITGIVTLVTQLPLISDCAVTATGSWPGDFEVEGIDYDSATGALRVEVIPPGICGLTGDVYVYTIDGHSVGTASTTTSTTPPATDDTSDDPIVTVGPAFTG